MIKLELNVEDMCHECPYFEEEVKATKFYAIDKIAGTDITVLCKNRDFCERLKSFLKDELTPEEINTCESDVREN